MDTTAWVSATTDAGPPGDAVADPAGAGAGGAAATAPPAQRRGSWPAQLRLPFPPPAESSDTTPPGDPAGGAPGIDASRLPAPAALPALAALAALAAWRAVGAGVDSPIEAHGVSGVAAGRPAAGSPDGRAAPAAGGVAPWASAPLADAGGGGGTVVPTD